MLNRNKIKFLQSFYENIKFFIKNITFILKSEFLSLEAKQDKIENFSDSKNYISNMLKNKLLKT